MRRVFLSFFLLIFSLGCGKAASENNYWEQDPPPEFIEAFALQRALSWELPQEGVVDTSDPMLNRKLWSNFLYSEIHKKSVDFYGGALDAKSFCPNYEQLKNTDRLNFWGELMAQIAKYESGFLPSTIFREPSRVDRLTRKPLLSEGLFQMSYQDSLFYEDCRFNWTKDSFLHPLDTSKSTLNPFHNIRCAVSVMAAQLRTKKWIVFTAAPYWAVLSPRRPTQLSKIKSSLSQLPFCKERKKPQLVKKTERV